MRKIDNRIIEEIARYNSINQYIVEQDATLPPPPAEDPNALPPADPAAGAPVDPNLAPPAPAAPTPQPIDVDNDPDVEKLGDDAKPETAGGSTEELDITDLVNSQKKVEEKQEEYFNNLFQHLTDLETKLGEMDGLMTKLNDIEAKIEKYRVKTPEEKLELRSIDSAPFNQKLSQFFQDKEEDLDATGKEYILTSDEVEDFSPDEIRGSFTQAPDQEFRKY